MASDTFGIDTDQLSIDVNKYLDRKERKRASKAQESLSRESIKSAREKASVDIMNSIIQKSFPGGKRKIGLARDDVKQEKKAKRDEASRLSEQRRLTKEKREEAREKREIDIIQKEREHEMKMELEEQKAGLKEPKIEKASTPEQKVKERQRTSKEGVVADAIRNRGYEAEGEDFEINTPEEAEAFATEQGVDFESLAVNRAITMTFGIAPKSGTGDFKLETFKDVGGGSSQGGESGNTVTIKKNGMTIRYDFDKGTKTRIL